MVGKSLDRKCSANAMNYNIKTSKHFIQLKLHVALFGEMLQEYCCEYKKPNKILHMISISKYTAFCMMIFINKDTR
ncbi:hypothetical protein T05_14561 [Trichinella murrelli]|uniref:Uncharacterized protein n=1 Tax=Trichinella murrelli TaxID=144512 RepID=A0A0V0UHY0_9BILA|nr:hypothetical protein T05_14561 [Trichinella murrelli]